MSDDAQRKFANAKAISSDMFFGKQDYSEVTSASVRWGLRGELCVLTLLCANAAAASPVSVRSARAPGELLRQLRHQLRGSIR